MKRNSRVFPRASGFTLVEVMVALLITGLTLPPLLMAFANQSDGIAYLRDKSMAQWVASNKLEETRLVLRRSQSLFEGERSGVTEMADREWFWWISSQPTGVEQFYRVEIKVAQAEDLEDQPLFTLFGFVRAEATDGA